MNPLLWGSYQKGTVMRLQTAKAFWKSMLEKFRESVSSAAPIVVIVVLLYAVLLREQVSGYTLAAFLIGAAMLMVGSALFTLGADLSMMPIGEKVGSHLTKTRKIGLICAVCFIIGFMITIAEPDLKVLADQVPIVETQVLIYAVAAGIGIFLVLSFLRILLQIRLSYLLLVFYALIFALILSPLIPNDFVAIAFDSGGVTTGPITVPFIMALGLGLASLRGDKTSQEDSFGLVALCSVGPILTVLLLGIFNGTDGVTAQEQTVTQFIGMGELLWELVLSLPHYTKEVLSAVVPIVIFFVIYQLAALRLKKRVLIKIFVGLVYTTVGLIIFLTGVNVGFMPMGYEIGRILGGSSYAWILVPLAAVIGYFIVAAEPAVHVLKEQVEDITNGAISARTMGLALAVGVSVSAGVSLLRVLTGLDLLYILLPCYAIALLITFFVPPIFTSVSFDSGGVASGPMTATFLLPLAQGACEAVGGNQLTDAFGVVAMVAMTPLLTIQVLGLIAKCRSRAGKPAELALTEGGLMQFAITLDDE